jgi:2-C-methyl-D-erythritol 4-phosphate cytidylyltransferase
MINGKVISVVIPAAGQGKRMQADVSKQYIEIDKKPILAYTIEKFEKEPLIDEIIVVVGKEEKGYTQKYIKDCYDFEKVSQIVAGGKERQDSVYQGLLAIRPDAEYVLIHDGARPFITSKDIENVIIETVQYRACVLGVKVKDTIKIVDQSKNVVRTPDRSSLYSIQTPQAFEKELIIDAYKKGVNEGISVTDDSMLVERYSNVKVKIVDGSDSNFKITTPHDLELAKSIIINKR